MGSRPSIFLCSFDFIACSSRVRVGWFQYYFRMSQCLRGCNSRTKAGRGSASFSFYRIAMCTTSLRFVVIIALSSSTPPPPTCFIYWGGGGGYLPLSSRAAQHTFFRRRRRRRRPGICFDPRVFANAVVSAHHVSSFAVSRGGLSAEKSKNHNTTGRRARHHGGEQGMTRKCVWSICT